MTTAPIDFLQNELEQATQLVEDFETQLSTAADAFLEAGKSLRLARKTLAKLTSALEAATRATEDVSSLLDDHCDTIAEQAETIKELEAAQGEVTQ